MKSDWFLFYFSCFFFFVLTLMSKACMWNPSTWLEPWLFFFFCLWRACQPQRKAWQTWNLLFETKGIHFDVCQCDTHKKKKKKKKKATKLCEHVGIQNLWPILLSLFLWRRLLKRIFDRKKKNTSEKKDKHNCVDSCCFSTGVENEYVNSAT